MHVLVAQLCPVLCDPMDCSPPGSSVHGILQARILEWVASPFSKGFSQPRDQWVDHNAGILHCRQILDRLSQEGSLGRTVFNPKGQSIREPLRLLSSLERKEWSFSSFSHPPLPPTRFLPPRRAWSLCPTHPLALKEHFSVGPESEKCSSLPGGPHGQSPWSLTSSAQAKSRSQQLPL